MSVGMAPTVSRGPIRNIAAYPESSPTPDFPLHSHPHPAEDGSVCRRRTICPPQNRRHSPPPKYPPHLREELGERRYYRGPPGFPSLPEPQAPLHRRIPHPRHHPAFRMTRRCRSRREYPGGLTAGSGEVRNPCRMRMRLRPPRQGASKPMPWRRYAVMTGYSSARRFCHEAAQKNFTSLPSIALRRLLANEDAPIRKRSGVSHSSPSTSFTIA